MEEKIKLRDFYITNDFCLIIGKVGVIADTHLGFDICINERGGNFPQIQKDSIAERINNIIDKYKLKTLVINGDIKHNFELSYNEIKFAKEFLGHLKEKVNLVLIRGNHDTFISKVVEELGIEIYNHYEIKSYTITHGHTNFKENKNFLILGHEHPSIKLRDEVGAILKLPCYLYNKRYIVLPAFNPLSPGNDLVNNYASSPCIKRDYLDSEVYAITELGLLNFGTLRDLREFVKVNL
jgi:putative SbcD/Mre11-related phosphoesterase